jgi:putative Mg2+ transporter-C (MgtC) family protein
MMDPTDLTETSVRLLLAAVFGGLIGLEREMHSQPAGLRTHMVVAVGAALIMIVSIKAGRGYDPTRIAAQIVSGIGFLGAGAILRFGTTVKGLTTAACLWTAAGIGLAVGGGFWREAGAATIVVLIAILLFDFVEKMYLVGRHYKRFRLLARDLPDLVSKAEATLAPLGVEVKQIGINKDKLEGKVELSLTSTVPENADLETTVRRLSDMEGVEKVEVE